MREAISQDCPLCSSPAEYYLVDYGKRKYFKCPKCTLFQITLRAEKILLDGPQQWRDGYALAAKQAPEGQALTIQVPSQTQNIGDPTQAVSGVYVERFELPQGSG
jgi:hypothetical protein